MNAFKQAVAVTLLSLRSLPQRIGSSLVIVSGIAGTVAVLVSVLAMAAGFLHTANKTGRSDRVIVTRVGSDSESTSTISRESAQVIMNAPGVRRDSKGNVVASAEALLIVGLSKQSDGLGANVALRGVGPNAFALRPQIKLTAGRMFQRGTRELIAGKGVAAQFGGLAVGSHLTLHGDWVVVGQFESDGDSHESELMADAETVLAESRRNLFQVVAVMLESPLSFERFKASVTTNPRLAVDAMRETDYLARESRPLTRLMHFAAYVVGGIMSVGAVCCALNSFYAAVNARRREIATLRAIGFNSAAVVMSVFIEATLLALVGGVLGALLAWLLFNGDAINTLGGNISQVVFELTVTPHLVTLGITWACVIGLVGGLFPALHAARRPIATALRDT